LSDTTAKGLQTCNVRNFESAEIITYNTFSCV